MNLDIALKKIDIIVRLIERLTSDLRLIERLTSDFFQVITRK